MSTRRKRRGGYIEPFALAGRVTPRPLAETLLGRASASPTVLVGVPVAAVLALAFLL